VTDDRQTDHATKKCVGIDVIACAARATPSNSGNCIPAHYTSPLHSNEVVSSSLPTSNNESDDLRCAAEAVASGTAVEA